LPKKQEIMIDTIELREVLKLRIDEFGGRELFCEAVGMSVSSLNGKLSRRKRNNGTHEEIYLEEFKVWYKVLMDEDFIYDYEKVKAIYQGKETLEEKLNALDYYYKCLGNYS